MVVVFGINGKRLPLEVKNYTRNAFITYNPKVGSSSALDPQASILEASNWDDDVLLAHVGLIFVRVSLSVYENHSRSKVRREANIGGLFKNIASNCFV